MVEPVTLTAGMIASIAFQELAKAGAGEVAKQAVGGAVDLVKSLRDKIRTKFQGDKRAEAALSQVEQEGSQAALTKLEVYLDDAMAEDQGFASEIRQIAQQIINVENQNISSRQYSNYGRDQNNVENVWGDFKIGGS